MNSGQRRENEGCPPSHFQDRRPGEKTGSISEKGGHFVSSVLEDDVVVHVFDFLTEEFDFVVALIALRLEQGDDFGEGDNAFAEEAAILFADWRPFGITELDQFDHWDDGREPVDDIGILSHVVAIENDAEVVGSDASDDIERLWDVGEESPIVRAAAVHGFDGELNLLSRRGFGEFAEGGGEHASGVVAGVSASAAGMDEQGFSAEEGG